MTIDATCCIVGAGPAGAVLGLLLARAGIDVVVLEKHDDFLRDFRGDTVHASTIRTMDELGYGERFLALPHHKVKELRFETDEGMMTVADFGRLSGPYRFIALMPQWDFLEFITSEARRYPSFELLMGAEASELLYEGEGVAGVTYMHGDGTEEVRAPLTVACDGRDSLIRRGAGLRPVEFGAPMDVLWFRLSRRASDPEETFGRLGKGELLVLINRGGYWQSGYVIPKGAIERVQAAGLEAFRGRVMRLAPWLGDRTRELANWEDVKLLRVQVDRLRRWHRPGLLCIGDAAHAMSPVGGVGINLAVQDAVAAANLLVPPLRDGTLEERHLARVQRRRTPPTIVTQGLQRLIQRRFLSRLLEEERTVKPPRLLRFGMIRQAAGYLVAIGVWPEHVRVDERSV
jgi:2-polyprenyl-6-methoxyphenol hydroxylase-like FAD-dependent oxidoreductase